MNIAKYIDHTLLKPDATRDQIAKLCEEAKQYGFASVCVNPTWVDYCSVALKDNKVKVCAVVGFPLGANNSYIKVAEARSAVSDGADEIDMVMNIGALKSGDIHVVAAEIVAMRYVLPQVILKVIIETCLLTYDEKITACQFAEAYGANFVKTSTGFSTGGATVEDVKLMRRVVGPKMGVKASGGIRDFQTAKAMIDAGANRLGCSAGVAIVKEALSKI